MKKYKPTTFSRRGTTKRDNRQLTKKVRPFKKLLKRKKSTGGRTRQGKITVRHRGGGHKKKYRIIDFKRKKHNMSAKVESIEYDPNRSCYIALVSYENGEKNYILAPQGIKEGDKVVAGENVELKEGNRTFLKNMPIGTHVYNIELFPEQGGKIVRAAGNSAQLMAVEGGHARLVLPSGEIRLVPERAMASIGQLSNPEHTFRKLGKAGRSRLLGRRPTVRGSAMSPVDHPHGGGEGKAPIGLRRGPKTPWGKQAYGVKTRKKKKYSDKFIIKRRKKKKRK